MTTKNRALLIVGCLFFFGSILRLYDLSWGAPYYFHPDERNIVSSIGQLHYPDNFNPKFFAYGSLPLYVIYFFGILTNLFHLWINQDPFQLVFEQAILLSRTFSALFSIALIPLTYFLGRKLHSKTAGIIVAFLTTTSVGLIQYAHFGTFEMWLTILSVLLFLCCLRLIKRMTFLNLFTTSVVLGALVAVKISSLALLPLPLLAMLIGTIRHTHHKTVIHALGTHGTLLITSLFFISTAALLYFATNPFVFFDYTSFHNSISYESGVALGTLPVFYTGEFFRTIPVVYSFFSAYPFLINPLILLLFVPSVLSVLYQAIRQRNTAYFLLLLFFAALFFSQAVLFVKWTRYLVPTLPFLYLIVALAIIDAIHFVHKYLRQNQRIVTYALLFLGSIICGVFALSYTIAAFVQEDTRLQARSFAKQTIPQNAAIGSEVYDMGITPFNENFAHITLYNTYDIDTQDVASAASEKSRMLKSEYLILPSQRLLKTRLKNSHDFPNGHSLYTSLMDGSAGFKQIYQTPCDLWCIITYLNNPIYRYEGTVNVFDRPVVTILKKTH